MSGATGAVSGTVRTANYLLGSEFQDGQASGSIPPYYIRDLIATVQSWTVAQIPSGTSHTSSYTLALTDAESVVEMSSTSSTILTVPPNSSVAFQVGDWLQVYNNNTGTVTISGGTGVTFLVPSTLSLAMSAQYGTLVLRQRTINQWVVS